MPGPAERDPDRPPRSLSPVVAATGLTCQDVADLLPGITDGSAPPTGAVGDHVGSCLRCQAEVAHYRRVLRVLRTLGSEVVEPPPGALAAVLVTLEAEGQGRDVRSALSGRRAAYLSGVVVATAASAAGVVVWATRRRIELAS